MPLILRRSRADDPEQEAEVPRALDALLVHALLHQHGAGDLAALLLLRLTPDGACELASLLARFRRQHTQPRLLRSYRRLLTTEQARALDQVVAFLLGAGHAGCRVYPDPTALEQPDAPSDHLVVDGGGAVNQPEASHPTAVPSALPEGIMPAWLPRPKGSSWER